MSLGLLSKWTKALKDRADRQAIASTYGIDEKILCSFLHHLSNVRNICAHHGRLWNRRFTFTMKIPRSPKELHALFNLAAERQVYNTLTLLGHMLTVVSPGSTWRHQLRQFLAEHPQAEPSYMGFPAGWDQRPEWTA
jgi:abortive infection bacteriophage resistance protein